MAIQFINDGATIKIITPEYTRNVQKDAVKINVEGDCISIRADKFGDRFKYDQVTQPVSANIDDLRSILESWLEAENNTGTIVTLNPSQLDSAGRLQAGLPVVLGDYKFINNILPEQMDTEVNGGTITHNAGTNSADLTTANNGEWCVIQSNQWHPYFNGKSQQPEFTFIGLDTVAGQSIRIGYFNSSTTTPFNTSYDGIWLRSEGGTVYFEIFRNGTEVLSLPQTGWNDPLDGTGSSGVTINWANFNVVYFDFLYLGGTACKFYMLLNGVPTEIHQYVHANNVPNTIIGTPAQPLRAELRQTDTTGKTFKFVCGQVTSNGDANQLVGFPIGISIGDSRVSFPTSGNRYVALAIRLKTGYNDLSLFQEAVDLLTTAGTNNSFSWELRLNPTLSAGSYTWNDTDKIGVEYHKGTGGAVSPEIINADGYLLTTGNGIARTDVSGAISKLRRLGTAIDGTSDIMVLAYLPHDNNQNAHATMNFNVL